MISQTRPLLSHNDLVRFHTPTRSPAVERFAFMEDAPSPTRVRAHHRSSRSMSANRILDFAVPVAVDHRASTPRSHKHSSNSFLSRSFLSHSHLNNPSDHLGAQAEIIDPGSTAAPIVHFRRQLWKHLDRRRENLNLDLFWPMETGKSTHREAEKEAEGLDIFPVEDLAPLCNFRNLRSLKLGGMLQSYQKHIWRCCWLNPELWELGLEMALEPKTRNPYSDQWPVIQGDWKCRSESEGSAVYM